MTFAKERTRQAGLAGRVQKLSKFNLLNPSRLTHALNQTSSNTGSKE